MIREFEEALARGEGAEDFERLRQTLMQRADDDRRERIRKIETDYKSVQLIQFGLAQDRSSPVFGIARGFCNWLKKKYPAPEDNLAKSLLREARREEYESKTIRKGEINNDATEGKQSGITSGSDRESGGEPTSLSKGVQADT